MMAARRVRRTKTTGKRYARYDHCVLVLLLLLLFVLLVLVGIGLIIVVIVYCRRDSVSFHERVPLSVFPLPFPVLPPRVFTRANAVSCPVETCEFHARTPRSVQKVDTNTLRRLHCRRTSLPSPVPNGLK